MAANYQRPATVLSACSSTVVSSVYSSAMEGGESTVNEIAFPTTGTANTRLLYEHNTATLLLPEPDTVDDSRPEYEHSTLPTMDYHPHLDVDLVPRCYLCDTPNDLQCVTVGKRVGKHICGGCLDGALRSVDGD